MICSNQFCQADIPADSLFCDQCGRAVSKQASSERTIDVDQNEESGQRSATAQPGARPMVQSEGPKRSEAVAPIPGYSSGSASATETLVKADAATAFAGRPVQAMDTQVLRLALSDGSTVELTSGDVLGRGEGPLALAWKDAGLVSDRHGKAENFEGSWSYTDLFSANGSSLNGHFVRPGKAVALQPGDKLVLGNRSCVVL